MSTCPAGHTSADPEWCDTCGLAMRSGAAPAAPPAPAAPCPSCGAALDGRFCEECGHDAFLTRPGPPPSALPSPGPAAHWTAVVRADPDWFAEVRRRDGPDAAGLAFPPPDPDRHVVLDGGRAAIGRHSRSRGSDPEIDLTDPGVSTRHAVLVARGDGWEIVDLDSTNGTTVGDRPLAPHVPTPLADGDVIRLGAWTAITLSRQSR